MNQLLADIEAIDSLFSDESKWTKGAWARDIEGVPTWGRDSAAVCWCLSGMVRHWCLSGVTRQLAGGIARYRAIDNVFHDAAEGNYIALEDSPDFTFADLKALISKAKARAGEPT